MWDPGLLSPLSFHFLTSPSSTLSFTFSLTTERRFSFLCAYFVLCVFLVNDACLFFVAFDLVLSCSVIVVSRVVGASVII